MPQRPGLEGFSGCCERKSAYFGDLDKRKIANGVGGLKFQVQQSVDRMQIIRSEQLQVIR